MQPISQQVKIFVPAVVTVAAFTMVLLSREVAWRDWQPMLLFYVLVVIAFSVRIPHPRGGAVTPSTVLSYLAIYLFNPPTALLLVGVGRTIGYIISRGWIPWRAFVNGALMALSVALGGLAFSLAGGVAGRIEIASSYLAFIAGPVAHIGANHFFVAFGLSRERGTPFLSTWLHNTREFLLEDVLHIPTAIFLAVLYTQLSHLTIFAYLVLLPFQWAALRLYLKQRDLYAQIVDSLVVAIEVDLPRSRGHARRVADLASALAREMRLSETTVETIQFAALLHDIGMIGKDESLDLEGTNTETPEEIQDNVRVGAEIARELPRKEIATLILHHHERYDGSGYPMGLAGEAIPLGARVIALAESVDSMARGVHKHFAPLPIEDVRACVEAESGRSFDPRVVTALVRLLERGVVHVEGSHEREKGHGRSIRLGEFPT